MKDNKTSDLYLRINRPTLHELSQMCRD